MLGNGVGRGLHGEEGAETLSWSERRATRAVRESESAMERSLSREPKLRRSKRRRAIHINASTVACALLAGTFQTSMAQGCISLKGSTACPAFNASSISTDDALVGFYPFLSTVSDTDSFDSGLRSYISDAYAQIKYAFLHHFKLI